MPAPVHYCAKCGKKMVYDAEISKKKERTVWWCQNDSKHNNGKSIVEVFEEFDVIDAVTSARRYYFTGNTT